MVCLRGGKMFNLKNVVVNPDQKVIDVVKVIDQGGIQIALVVGDNKKLLGTVTDGDVRRGLLKGVSLDSPVKDIMNTNPIIARKDQDKADVLQVMKDNVLRHVPVVDNQGQLCDLELYGNLVTRNEDVWVVLMAGGLGSRLGSLTEDCPKPLLKVGDKPVLETILTNIARYGFSKFYLSINYKGDMIKDYFGDGSRWGVEIKYIEETERLGTAGALSLLPEPLPSKLIVMNGDLLTKVNFDHLLQFHNDSKGKATMCVREYDFTVPFGVVQLDEHEIVDIDEKPMQKFFVNAGIYVLESSALKNVTANKHLDMTTLFESLIEKKQKTLAFPIHEYWLDIGRVSDLEKASDEFKENFVDQQ